MPLGLYWRSPHYYLFRKSMMNMGHWRHSSIFIINFEQIPHFVQHFCWYFEQVNGRWESIQENCSLREKYPITEFFLVRIFSYSDWIRENTDQKKLRIWTLFTQYQFYNEDQQKLQFYQKDSYVTISYVSPKKSMKLPSST